MASRELDRELIAFIDASSSKVTYAELKRHFCDAGGHPTDEFKQALRHQINSGKLSYAGHFGRTVIEISSVKTWFSGVPVSFRRTPTSICSAVSASTSSVGGRRP